MTNRAGFILIIVFSFALINPLAAQVEEFIPGELFFKISDDVELNISEFENNGESNHGKIDESFAPLVERYSITSIRMAFHLNDSRLQKIYLLRFEKVDSTRELMNKIKALDFIEYVEQVPLYKTDYTPNDLHPNQWHLNTIQAQQAWNLSTGSANVVVAIVDDAVLLSHEDLTGNIWLNPNEISGNNIDDDANGYLDDINGYDVADNDNDPNPPTVNPGNHSHGAHCAGIVAAVTDNSIGIASIGFNISIMAVKTQGATTPPPYLTNPYDGIQYAIAARADVISMSWGGGGYSAVYQTLFDYAHSLGIVLVAAAGNSNTNILHYPAAYNYVISVGATDDTDQKAGFSNYGSWVDVMAPGKDIWSTLSSTTSSYGFMSGTSMACPLVAGLCGLMLSHAPGMPPDDLEDCLKNSCDNIDSQNPNYTGLIGAGRINAYKALICLSLPPVVDFTADFTEACPNQPIQFADMSAGIPATSWLWTFPGGTPANSALQNPVVTYPTTGIYSVALTATNIYGSTTLTKTAYVIISRPSAVLSGNTIIIQGTSAFLIINFTGNPPWSITYSDGSVTQTISGINTNPYFFPVTPSSSTTYALVSMSDGFCTGTVSGSATIQVVSPAQAIECAFSNIYGDAGEYHFHHAYFDPVANVIYGVGKWVNNKPFMVKIARLGNIIWAKSLNSIPDDSGMSILPATNNELLISWPNNDDIIISRIDTNGNMLWTKRFATPVRERVPRMIQSIGDTYIVGAWHASSSDDAFVMRIDGNGNMIWAKRFTTDDDQMGFLASNGNGGCLMTGEIINSGVGIYIFMGEVDVNGNALWLKTININYAEQAYGILKTSGGEYVLNGKYGPHYSSINNGFIIKLDANLNVVWTSKFNNVSGINSMTNLIQDRAGNFYIPYKALISGTEKIAVIKYNPNGNYLWAKTFDYLVSGVGGFSVLSLAVNTPADNIVMAGGTNTAPGGFGGIDGFIARLDTSLNSCIVSPYDPTHFSDTWVLSNWNPGISNVTVTPTPITVTVNNLVFGKNELCVTCGCFSVASISASDTVACAGNTITFASDSVSPFYEWKINGISFSNSRNTSYVFNSPGTYLITLFVSDSVCTDIDSVTILVNELPIVDAQPDTLICTGSDVQLIATGGMTYSWLPYGGLNNPNIPNPVATALSSITYHVTATDANGCKGEDSVFIQVISCCGSLAAFTVSDTIICVGETVTVINQSVSNGAASYIWNFGSGAVPVSSSQANPPPIYYASGGNFEIILILTDSCGMDTAKQNIYVYNPPVASAGDDTSAFCSNDTLDYRLGEPPVSYYTYRWSPPAGLSDIYSSEPVASWAPPVSYYLEVTDIVSGCKSLDTVNIISENASLNMNASITRVLCEGGNNGGIKLNPFGGTAPYQASWSNSDTSLSLENLSPDIYYVTVTDANGCKKDTSFSLTAASTYQIEAVASDASCDGTHGGSAQVNIISATTAPYSYLWSTGAVTSLITDVAEGIYSVTVSDSLSCLRMDTATVGRASGFFISVEITPVTCPGFTDGAIDVSLSGGSAPFNYLWSTGSTAEDISSLASGNYILTVSDQNDCGAKDTFVVSTDANADCDSLIIWDVFSPNGDGANDGWVIDGVRDYLNNELQIFNRWGNVVFEAKPYDNTWKGISEKGEPLPSATYYYILKLNDPDESVYAGHVTLIR